MKRFISFTQKKSISFLTSWEAKIIFLIGIVLSISNQGKAQVLYGTTRNGGYGAGTITKYDVSSNTLTDVFVYEVPGARPNELVEASNGKLYGTTSEGGNYNGGTIYSLDAGTYKYTKLKDFEPSVEYLPRGGLVEGADKKLYGTTAMGGLWNAGTIFSFDPASLTYTTLKTFTYGDGSSPAGNLVQLSDGRLYGTAEGDGVNSAWVIFSFDPVSLIYTVLKHFDDPLGGRLPTGNLLKGADGKLYGTAAGGSFTGGGVIYSLDPGTGKYIKLRDFSGQPSGGLMQAANGRLYGMTSNGGYGYGTIFSYDLNPRRYTVIKKFNDRDDDHKDGYHPEAGLIQANNGKLYGTTRSAGEGGNFAGTLFSLDTGTNVFQKIRDFDYFSGAGVSGIIKTSDGKLIAGMRVGGSTLNGAIFTFDPGPGVYALVDVFFNRSGSHPSGPLLVASDGKLYGMTTEGGKKNKGVIFYFDPVSAKYKKVKDFNGARDGSYPNGSLIEAPDKLLYGTTPKGGSGDINEGGGVLFSLDPVSLTYTKLKDFHYRDGYHANDGLIHARGKLFGTTSLGGTFGKGVIFSFDPVIRRYNKLKNLSDETAGPSGSLINGLTYAKDKDFYGLSKHGNTSGNLGVLFSIDPPTSKFTQHVNGSMNEGYHFSGKLIQAPDNKLYGLAQGGIHNYGVIFSYEPATFTYKKLKEFSFYDNVANPIGSMLLASDGKLYGSTEKGGPLYYEGVLFSFDIKDSAFKKLLNLQSPNGVNTLSTLVEYPANPAIALRTMPAPQTQKAGPSLFTIKVSPNPSNTNFLVEIQSNIKDEAIEIVVTDISGRRVYQRTGALPGQYRFGDLFTPGVYFVRVTQGQNIQTLKVIKAGTSVK